MPFEASSLTSSALSGWAEELTITGPGLAVGAAAGNSSDGLVGWLIGSGRVGLLSASRFSAVEADGARPPELATAPTQPTTIAATTNAAVAAIVQRGASFTTRGAA